MSKKTESSKATALRSHLCGDLRAENVGGIVTLCGWVGRRREHGEHLAFLDLRDFSGVVQCVVDNKVDVRSEWVVQIKGKVNLRPAGTVNENLPTGKVELTDCEIQVLNNAEPPPFPIDQRGDDVDENVRL
ncbi:MAG: OB-fold nucleic acid binding domain-containing protein, partial [Actinomycetota bacterium]